MTEVTQPREAEAIPVTLAHITGAIGGVAKDVVNVLEKVTDLKAEVIQHRGQISGLQSEMQQVKSDAKTAAKAVIDAEEARQTTAELLKEATKKALDDAKAADDKKVLDAKLLVEQSTTTWSKRQTLAAIGAFVLALIVGVFGIIWAIKTGTPPPTVLKP
jgi:ParB-like chromosome segregation protein Spo0J